MNSDLSTVLNWIGIKSDSLNIAVTGLCHDSRKITNGDLFLAISGYDNHGIDFAYQVQRAGACAILAETVKDGMAKPKGRQQPLTIPVIEIENLSEKLGVLAANFYDNPSEKLEVIGITGTNGKTSCAWLMLQAWEQLGVKGAYIGTLGYGNLQQMNELQNTTPNPLHLQRILSDFVKQGITHVSLEVSSHGLSLGRVTGTRFVGAGLSNISRDHLDFHESMEHYSAAKLSLFKDYELDFSVINSNDYYGKQWISKLDSVVSYAVENTKADLNATDINLTPKGIQFSVVYKQQSYPLFAPLLGHFNVENILLVLAVLSRQGFQWSRILECVPLFKSVPGRMNSVEMPSECSQCPLIIVDYAHTPDALKQVLMALKQHKARKIWCIFGCGGNRDKGKRPQMGHIAESLADVVIVTDDNPRHEDAQQIAEDILMGMNTSPLVIHSRKEAISHAIEHAQADDLIVIAGKGHEPYQLIKGHYYQFDDRVVATELLASLKEKCA